MWLSGIKALPDTNSYFLDSVFYLSTDKITYFYWLWACPWILKDGGFMPQSSCSRGSNSGLGCLSGKKWHELRVVRAAMVQFIFWREYLSSAEKQERVRVSPQVSLDLWTGIGCHVAMTMSPSAECHVLRRVFWSTQRENRVVQQLSFWTVAISLRAVAQKLHWLHSFPKGFGGPEVFPQF
jgi:hypothetical protein